MSDREHIASPEYSGVVLASKDWRVVAGPKGNRYWLQRLGPSGLYVEVKRRKSPRDLAAVLPPECPIPPSKLLALPADAALAAPETVARRARLNEAFRLNDWSRDDYARRLETDGLWAIAVSPDPAAYLALRAAGDEDSGPSRNSWRKVRSFASAAEALSFFRPESEWVEGVIGRDFTKSDRLRAALEALPNDPADGIWASLPPRPETAREVRQRAKRDTFE